MLIKHDNNIDICGTSLMGEIDCSYYLLKRLFGNPCNGDGYKIDAQWCLRFPCGTIATIYNYKTGKNYNGKSGQATSRIRDWHIGGHDLKAVDLVLNYIIYNAK